MVLYDYAMESDHPCYVQYIYTYDYTCSTFIYKFRSRLLLWSNYKCLQTVVILGGQWQRALFLLSTASESMIEADTITYSAATWTILDDLLSWGIFFVPFWVWRDGITKMFTTDTDQWISGKTCAFQECKNWTSGFEALEGMRAILNFVWCNMLNRLIQMDLLNRLLVYKLHREKTGEKPRHETSAL